MSGCRFPRLFCTWGRLCQQGKSAGPSRNRLQKWRGPRQDLFSHVLRFSWASSFECLFNHGFLQQIFGNDSLQCMILAMKCSGLSRLYPQPPAPPREPEETSHGYRRMPACSVLQHSSWHPFYGYATSRIKRNELPQKWHSRYHLNQEVCVPLSNLAEHSSCNLDFQAHQTRTQIQANSGSSSSSGSKEWFKHSYIAPLS